MCAMCSCVVISLSADCGIRPSFMGNESRNRWWRATDNNRYEPSQIFVSFLRPFSFKIASPVWLKISSVTDENRVLFYMIGFGVWNKWGSSRDCLWTLSSLLTRTQLASMTCDLHMLFIDLRSICNCLLYHKKGACCPGTTDSWEGMGSSKTNCF